MEGRSGLVLFCANVAGHFFSPNDPADLAGRLKVVLDEIERLSPDVACIQELYSLGFAGLTYSAERAAFVAQVASLGFSSASSPTPWFGMDAGLLILSKSGLENVQSLRFAQQDGLFGSKGALRAKVCGSSLVVVCCHLSWKESSASQLSELREFASDADVVCGDFNRALSGRDVGLHFGNCAVCSLHAPTHDDGGNYDHVFVRKEMKTQNARIIELKMADGSRVSDHRCIECTIDE
jgi:endonuclease/exonuclease/phosphatase family metal-dependent hydrolase